MRNFIIVVVILALLAGGYSFYWHRTANNIQTATVQALDALNAHAKPYTKDLSLIRYDSVTVTGFPFAMRVEVSKPILDVPVSAFIQEFQQRKGVATPAAFEWVEEIAYDDKLVFNANASGNMFSYSILGGSSQKTLVNRAVRHTLNVTYAAAPACSLEVASKSMLWSGNPLPATPDAFFAIMRSFTCNVPATVTKDSATQTPLVTADGTSFSINNAPDGPVNHKLGFKVALDKMKSTPAFDVIAKDYMLMVYTLLGKPEEAGAAFPTSEFGEQNVGVDFGYDGPLDAQSLLAPGLNLHLDINDFNVQNALETVSYEMHLAAAPQGTDRSISLSVHGTSQVTARYDELNQQHFVEMLKSMGSAPASDPGSRMFQKLASIGKPEDTVARLYPQSHTLGKTAIDIDINARGPSEAAQFLKHGILTIDNLNWTSVPYGIKVKGNANASVPRKPPTADFAFNCISCDAMIVDLGNYAMRVESVIDQYNDGKIPPRITKGLIDGTRLFLHGISENSAATDLVIHIAKKDSGMFTISNKQLPEVLGLYMTDIAPYLPRQPEQPGKYE